MTISHVIYLEFARLIVSWQWVTEVSEGRKVDYLLNVIILVY